MKKLILLLLLLPFALFANVAKVVAFSGEATIVRGDENIKVISGIELLESDVIKTSDNTKLQLIFKDETVVTIGKNSEFKINDYIFDEEQNNYNANLGLMKGTFRTITGKIGKVAPNKFKLNSKSASIGIRGTQILSNVELSGDTIYCTEGAIEITSQLTGETIQIQAGQFVQIKEDEPIVVQEFSLEDIDTIETETQFTSQEEKEQILESFGVEVEQVEPLEQTTQETQEDNQPLLSEVNDNSNTINESDTYDSIIEVTNNQENTSSTISGIVYEFNNENVGTIENPDILSINTTDLKINLKMQDFISNFQADNSYSGTLSSTSVQNESYGYELLFISGNYESIEDSSGSFDTNDDTQWGTWNTIFNDTYSQDTVNLSGYWLAGEQTSAAEVQNLISNNTTTTYNGYTLAKGSMSGFSYDASNSSVEMTIDFGNPTVSGTFNFNGTEVTVSGNSVTSSGFSFDNASGTDVAWGDGSGKFYGSNANSIGGTFKFGFYSDNQIKGIFKAKKQ